MSGRIERPIKPLSFFYYDGPSDTTQYCHDCKTSKPFRGSRCLECATRAQEIYASHKMPDRFMNASASSFTIGHIMATYRLEREHLRDLAPGERRLGWFVLPPFQRPPVWMVEQQVLFIESIWLDLPIGSYAYNEPEPYRHPTAAWLIDGQQRITAILDYVAGKFEAFGYHYPELDKIEQHRFEMSSFPAVVTKETDPAKLEDIYNRLAYGGTAHAPKVPA